MHMLSECLQLYFHNQQRECKYGKKRRQEKQETSHCQILDIRNLGKQETCKEDETEQCKDIHYTEQGVENDRDKDERAMI